MKIKRASGTFSPDLEAPLDVDHQSTQMPCPRAWRTGSAGVP